MSQLDSSDVFDSIQLLHTRMTRLENTVPSLAGWTDWIPTNGATKDEKALLEDLNRRLAMLEKYHESDGPLLMNVRDNVILQGALVKRLADRVKALESVAPSAPASYPSQAPTGPQPAVSPYYPPPPPSMPDIPVPDAPPDVSPYYPPPPPSAPDIPVPDAPPAPLAKPSLKRIKAINVKYAEFLRGAASLRARQGQ
jgi:hypothetical protein